MSDVSHHAPNCAGCEVPRDPATDPVEILRRLPQQLFDRRRPIPPDVATFDNIVLDVTPFGPIGGEEPTPQWELARILAQEKDEWVYGFRQALAMQLGLGRMQGSAEGVTCQCPRATGADLDQVGEQYGVGRPTGFTDCCYWRLILLLLFKPGTTTWLLQELAELYTGVRPAYVEEPCKISLVWPASGGSSYFGRRRDPEDGAGWFFGRNFYFTATEPLASANGRYGYWLSGPTHDNEAPAPRVRNMFWSAPTPQAAAGLRLRQALAIAKAAGIVVDTVNEPPSGLGGCYGATLRRPASGWFWAPGSA